MEKTDKKMSKNEIGNITVSNPVIPQIFVTLCGYSNLEKWDHGCMVSPFWYCWVTEKPGSTLICGSKKIELVPEKIVLIAPHTVFSTRSSGGLSQFFIHFFTGMERFQMPPGVFEIPHPHPEQLFSLLHRLRDTQDLTGLNLLAHSVAELSLLQIPPEQWKGEYQGMDIRIKRALRLINEQPGEDIPVARLAACAGMSADHFTILFKKEMKITPHRYIVLRRISVARELLSNSTQSIDEIAAALGFADRYHFSKQFRQYTGVAPGAFRHKNCKTDFGDG